MKLIKCPNGHIYDADQNSECPTCAKERGVDVTAEEKEKQRQVMYVFEHKALPQYLFEGKERFVALLKDTDFLYKVLSDLFLKNHVPVLYRNRNVLSVNHFTVRDGIFGVRIVFPQPFAERLCYFIYILYDKSFDNPAFYTVEKGGEYSDNQPFLCEWADEHMHINHGNCSLDDGDCFKKCVKLYVENRLGLRVPPQLYENRELMDNPFTPESEEAVRETKLDLADRILSQKGIPHERINSGDVSYIDLPYSGRNLKSFKIKVLPGDEDEENDLMITSYPLAVIREDQKKDAIRLINRFNERWIYEKYVIDEDLALSARCDIPRTVYNSMFGDVLIYLVSEMSGSIDNSYPDLLDVLGSVSD